jgi:hypothetical protein
VPRLTLSSIGFVVVKWLPCSQDSHLIAWRFR